MNMMSANATIRKSPSSGRKKVNLTLPHLAVGINNDVQVYTAILDSGSELTVLPGRVARDAGLNVRPTKCKLFGADGCSIAVTGYVRVLLRIGDLYLDTDALVAEKVIEITLGINWLRRHKVA